MHDARIRPDIESAAQHLEKARLALLRIDRLAFVAESVGGAVLDELCRRIESVIASLPALGGKRRPRKRPDKRHVTRLMFVLSEVLCELTGRRPWGEIAEFVNELGVGEQLSARHVEIRCHQYRSKEPGAVEKASEESRKFWEGS